MQQVVAFLGIAFAFFLATRLGFTLVSEHRNVAAFWPAAGIGVAALVFGGWRQWTAIALGAFCAHLFIHDFHVGRALVLTIGNTSEALIGAYIYQRVSRFGIIEPFTNFASSAAAAIAAPIPAALLGSAVLWHSGVVTSGSALFFTWWMGDALGILVTAPAIFLAAVWLRSPRLPTAWQILLSALLVAYALFAVWATFYRPAGTGILFLLLPIILLAAFWFGEIGVHLTCFSLVTLCTYAIVHSLRIQERVDESSYEPFLFSLALTTHLLAAFCRADSLRLPAFVLAGGWAVSGWLFYVIETDRQKLNDVRLDAVISETQQAITQTLSTYIEALRGGASLFAASDSVSRDEWRRFVSSLDISNQYPGIIAIGVVFPVRERNLGTFLAEVRADHAPNFTVHDISGIRPSSPDPAGYDHYIVTYLEPIAGRESILGLDLASEAKRMEAARIARDYGVPRISGRTIFQEPPWPNGFTLFMPMYFPDMPQSTVHERRLAFRGWVHAPFKTTRFFDSVNWKRDEIQLTVFDGLSTKPEDNLYSTFTNPTRAFARTTVFHLAGQRFTIGWTPGPAFESARSNASINAATLALVPALLGGLVMSLVNTARRARDLANQRTKELQDIAANLQSEVSDRMEAERRAEEARDVAEKAQAEAEAANAAKSDFLATMSHEIRTPMNGVLGYAELLGRSPLDREQASWANNIETSGRALLGIINDILDFSKIEAGKLQLESIRFDPLKATREVVAIMTGAARNKHLPIELDRPTPLPDAILGDPTRFKQVLFNLLSNAIKFTLRGSIRVRLAWEETGPSHGTLHCAVSDTGPGIPPEKTDRLFQKFSQLDSSTTRRFGGTGLGLAICKKIIELMGGHIGVRSAEGTGTTIWFDVPFETSRGEVETPEALRQNGVEKPGRGRRILLAEDVIANQRLAGTILKQLDCEVEIASNGREAVDKIRNAEFDLLFLDCQMPVMDGFDAARTIRDTEDVARHLPIIALTANAFAEDRERCLAAGMDDYISKPFSRADFIRVLEKW